MSVNHSESAPLHGPKWCDHREDRLGDAIGPGCLCDRGDCREPATRFSTGGPYFHYCEPHFEEQEALRVA